MPRRRGSRLKNNKRSRKGVKEQNFEQQDTKSVSEERPRGMARKTREVHRAFVHDETIPLETRREMLRAEFRRC